MYEGIRVAVPHQRCSAGYMTFFLLHKTFHRKEIFLIHINPHMAVTPWAGKDFLGCLHNLSVPPDTLHHIVLIIQTISFRDNVTFSWLRWINEDMSIKAQKDNNCITCTPLPQEKKIDFHSWSIHSGDPLLDGRQGFCRFSVHTRLIEVPYI